MSCAIQSGDHHSCAPLFTEDLLIAQPEIPFQLDQGLPVKNLKSARRGAAGGPSGMTAEHLRPLLDSEADCEKFWFLCQAFAQAHIPEEVVTAVRMGRITALQKPSGGIRGIVVGDLVRRLVSRTIAQQIGPSVEVATAPHQHAMSTRAGCECIAHMLQARTDLDDRATVLSIDGIGVFDLVSRESMLRGLLRVEGGDSVLPFVRQFYASPSSYIWQDEHGIVHDVPQGEGGEQGDALMPALFSLGQHPALEAVQSQLLEGETLCAFLDDLYAICRPDRVVPIFNLIQRELWTHSRIEVHLGKTQMWNRGGFEPLGCHC